MERDTRDIEVSRQQNGRGGSVPQSGIRRGRIVAGIVLLGVLAGAYIAAQETGALDGLFEGRSLERAVTQLGVVGPAVIVGLMAIAIVMSPIPSAPIALASGAIYGHLWGTLYVAIGSGTGAMVAFWLARFFGQDAVRAWLGARPSSALLNRFMRSQNALMAVVFATRLMPFLSFDVISYAAGLTPLKLWRFAIATFLGIMPASFLLAHFGGELASGDLERASLTVLALGTITLIPLAWRATPARWRAATRRLFQFKRAQR